MCWGPLDQSHDLPLRLRVPLYVPLRRLEGGVPGELLHVAERAPGLHDLLRGAGDERAPAGVRGAPVHAQPGV